MYDDLSWRTAKCEEGERSRLNATPGRQAAGRPSRDRGSSGTGRTVAHVPAEVAEAVEGVVRGGEGDGELGEELGPAGEGGKGLEERGRVELCADEGRGDVAEEEGVDGCGRGDGGQMQVIERAGASEANQREDRGARERRRERGAPAERVTPVARLAMDETLVSWGW